MFRSSKPSDQSKELVSAGEELGSRFGQQELRRGYHLGIQLPSDCLLLYSLAEEGA